MKWSDRHPRASVILALTMLVVTAIAIGGVLANANAINEALTPKPTSETVEIPVVEVTPEYRLPMALGTTMIVYSYIEPGTGRHCITNGAGALDCEPGHD